MAELGRIQERFCQPLPVGVDLVKMPLTRRHFLKVSSAGFLVAAGLPIHADTLPPPFPSAAFAFDSDLHHRIILMGIGGAGGSILSAVMKHPLPGVIHTSVHTDEPALNYHDTDLKILIGQRATHGLGCGARPEYGRRAIDESRDEVREILEGAHLVLVVGGMGGGTATGAAPVIAQLAGEVGALTVGVVTQPFAFEGRGRRQQAAVGISEMVRQADTTVVVPMDRMLNVLGPGTSLRQAYERLDEAIGEVARAIIKLIMVPGLINVNFSDVCTVLADGGPGVVGLGVGNGHNRAVEAAQAALQCPLLGQAKISGASRVLVDIAGDEVTVGEVDEVMQVIYGSLNDETLVSFGDTPDPNLHNEVRVTLIAAGIQPKMKESEIPAAGFIDSPTSSTFAFVDFAFQSWPTSPAG